jgi:hypothetical protein
MKILRRCSTNFLLEPALKMRHTTAAMGRRSVSMVRELQLLTVVFVFSFLGAIVMGVF